MYDYTVITAPPDQYADSVLDSYLTGPEFADYVFCMFPPGRMFSRGTFP